MGESSRRDRSASPSRRQKERDNEHRSSHKHSSRDKTHRHRYSDEENDDRRRKHRRDKDRDETEEERKERKRLKKEKRRESRKHEELDVVDDDDDGDMWVEKSVDGAVAVSNIPTSEALGNRSQAVHAEVPPPPSTSASAETRQREAWMLDPGPMATSATIPKVTRDIPQSAGSSAWSGGSAIAHENESMIPAGDGDFFSSLGTEHKRKGAQDDKPDPGALQIDRRELNLQLKEGKSLDEYEAPEKKKVTPGGPGHQWRMMKLKRLYEQAEEQGRDIEDVAMERYGSIEDFNEALEERRILDERDKRRESRRGGEMAGTSTPGSSGMRTPDVGGNKRFMFMSEEGASRPGSRAGFRRPGESEDTATPSGSGTRVAELRRSESGTPRTVHSALPNSNNPAKISTPIPNVFTPTSLTRQSSGYPFSDPSRNDQVSGDSTSSQPPMSTEALNKLQAKVIRARLMDDPKAQQLEEEYEREMIRSERAGGDQGGAGLWAGASGGIQGQMGREADETGRRTEIQVLPTLDGRGQLYDVGTGKQDEAVQRAGNRRKKPEKFETRDRQGNIIRYNADDDEQTLGELVRQERFGAGAGDQKDIDAEMASAITRDAKFDDDLDYMDDNAERLAQRKRKTDAMKRAFAINDFARTKKALDTCPFCYQDDRPPQIAMVALGTRTYMCCTQFEELVPGHCLIVPLQHHLSSLEMEDDDWEEIRNFMKCLMQMHAKDNKGVIFFETILSFKQQRHTFIEAIPVPFAQFQDLPAYFRESILASESEWTQHKKLIDFSSRPGGFRRMLVPNLPYFMVHWDYKGEKGYGHVIEGVDDDSGRGGGEEDMGGAVYEGEKGGSEFPKYFAAEIVGNLLGLEPRKWRKPRRMDIALNKERARALGTKFQPYNWTTQLAQQS
ncbi:CwfJ C-terminus 1-domain-containing protein-like protein [Kockovaella imperatae]|uniref:CwfJ C-terminus 1-domain-containing protein-like protein n=1 Tax=Kockovaella imperatae TaxID=4999 RepID=A0A1Y1UE44_9TREE|nr:CwfJ C-terminus 1-domain-containing protein-like protein [Kockovaella imperatae]ORX35345.1 CwfJ C-terminus 1-domain-containing protein-like protein [Kockovaella imperatae]